MSWLLWKDYRLNLSILVFVVALIVGPYAVGVAIQITNSWAFPNTSGMREVFRIANQLGLTFIPMSVALLAGNAIASERADRSSEFLASLPVSRAKIFVSKVIVTVFAVLVAWSIQLAVLYTLRITVSGAVMLPPQQPPIADLIFASLFAFGAGWAASACLESPVIAILCAIGAPILVGMILKIQSVYVGPLAGQQLYIWWRTACLLLGPALFLGGSWYYFRRVEP